MTFKIKSNKSRGRPKANFKVRSIKGITPRGFEFHKINGKEKTISFKKTK